MKSKIISTIIIFFTTTIIYAGEPSIIIRSADIEKKTDELFYDNSIRIDIDGNEKTNDVLYFSYSKFGPAPICTELDKCNLTSGPIITSYIETSKKIIHINFMCTSIGLYSTKTQGFRDIYCGPNVRLHWNGKNYIEE